MENFTGDQKEFIKLCDEYRKKIISFKINNKDMPPEMFKKQMEDIDKEAKREMLDASRKLTPEEQMDAMNYALSLSAVCDVDSLL